MEVVNRHQSLHKLSTGRVQTGGRLMGGMLTNAHVRIPVRGVCADEGQLVRVSGWYDGLELKVEEYQVFAGQSVDTQTSWVEACEHRNQLFKQIRAYFADEGFLEVETPLWVGEPGTDVFLDPVVAAFVPEPGGVKTAAYLQTSPEFLMKEMLSLGHERIFQLCKVFRNGEVTPIHNPEFSMLEFYRAWEDAPTIMADVEAIVSMALVDLPRPFERATMQDVFREACGLDILELDTADALRDAIESKSLLSIRSGSSWDELFFELVIEYLDPYLKTRGAIFVTDWPTRLAVLAQRNPRDPRVAERFELYVDGIELCNGFQELTDPVEQRQRFEEDCAYRQQRGYPTMPMPDRFLNALERGLPPSSGVAIGLDRLLMLSMGVTEIGQVIAFSGGPHRITV